MGDLAAAQFERHGRRHDDVPAIAGDIDMRRLAKSDEIVLGARVLAFFQDISKPIWQAVGPSQRCGAIRR